MLKHCSKNDNQDEPKKCRRLFIKKPDQLNINKPTLSLPIEKIKASNQHPVHQSLCHNNNQANLKLRIDSIITRDNGSLFNKNKIQNPFSFKQEETTIYIPTNGELGVVESEAKNNKKLRNLSNIHSVMCKMFLGEKVNKTDLLLSKSEVVILLEFLMRKDKYIEIKR